MDITKFMTWFISQVISIFTSAYSILDNIKFMGTSLLRVMVTIIILVPLTGTVLTISKNVDVITGKSERIREKKERANDRKTRREYYQNRK